MQSDSFSPGQTATYRKTISAEDLENFAHLSGDRNPLHFDSEYAAASRFQKRIAHGMLTASLISTVIGMQLPGPGAIYLGQELKFLKPVFPGDTITARAVVISYDEEKKLLILKTDCLNQHDEIVLSGEAKVRYEPIQ
jgi:3-hydroxybutyryl-CoA dehydratase